MFEGVADGQFSGFGAGFGEIWLAGGPMKDYTEDASVVAGLFGEFACWGRGWRSKLVKLLECLQRAAVRDRLRGGRF